MSDDAPNIGWIIFFAVGGIVGTCVSLLVLYGIVRLFFKYAFDVTLWNPFG